MSSVNCMTVADTLISSIKALAALKWAEVKHMWLYHWLAVNNRRQSGLSQTVGHAYRGAR